MIRDLKHYRWSLIDGKVILLDKDAGTEMILSMVTADSFVRAYISFKNRQRIEEKKVLRESLRNMREKNRGTIGRLRGTIGKLRGKEVNK